jgi:hypothetical protein
MKKSRIITESFLVNKIKKLLKEEALEEVIITPNQYYDLLKAVYYKAQSIPRLARFKNKKLVINGNIKLSSFAGQKFLTDLGNIKVNGDIDISHTNIKSLDNVEFTGRASYWSTPYDAVMTARRQQKKGAEQEERRENNEWDLNDTDEEGEKANAAFQYAVNRGNLKSLDDEEKEELQNLKTRLSELELQMKAEEDEERYDELSNEFDEVQEEIDNLSGDNVADVYDLYPNGKHYNMSSFECLSTGMGYAVGTEDEADESLNDYFDEMVESAKHYFNREHLSYYVDEEEVKEYYRDEIEEMVRYEPEAYDVEKELSSDQEEEIWVLQMEKWVYKNEGVRAPIKYPSKEEKGRIFDFMDENEEYEFQYRNESSDPQKSHWVLYKDGQVVPPRQIYDDEDTQEHKDKRESRISDIEYEIQEIKDSPDGEPNEDSIEEAVEDYLNKEIGSDAYNWLTDRGGDIEFFLDKKRLKADLISETDYGTLSSYDNNYDEIKINNTYYIVMRID